MQANVDVFDDVLNGVLKSVVFGFAVTLIALFEKATTRSDRGRCRARYDATV